MRSPVLFEEKRSETREIIPPYGPTVAAIGEMKLMGNLRLFQHRNELLVLLEEKVFLADCDPEKPQVPSQPVRILQQLSRGIVFRNGGTEGTDGSERVGMGEADRECMQTAH